MILSTELLHTAERRIHRLLTDLRPELLKGYGLIEHKVKSDQSIVTEMDLMVEEVLRQDLGEWHKDISFGGEETGINYDAETFWLVDPIDGTEPFVRGMPFSTNMVALIHQGRPVLGVVYNFFMDEYYAAIEGVGAACNGHTIAVSSRPLNRAYVVVTGNVEDMTQNRNFRADLRKITAGQPKLHASGCEAAMIARGAIDGVVVAGAKGPWDFAAGCLLIKEAGGRVENIGTHAYDYRNMQFIAASPAVFDDLAAFVGQR